MDKRKRELVKLAKKYNRSVEEGSGRHYKLVCNNGVFQAIFCSKTTSDHRALRNIERDLKNPTRKD